MEPKTHIKVDLNKGRNTNEDRKVTPLKQKKFLTKIASRLKTPVDSSSFYIN